MALKLKTPRRIRQPDDPHSTMYVAYQIIEEFGSMSTRELHFEMGMKQINDLRLHCRRAFTENVEFAGREEYYPSLVKLFGFPDNDVIITIDDIVVVLPRGLCGDMRPHEPHIHDSLSFGAFYCHADQSQRIM